LPGEILQEGPYTIVLAWADYLADATRRGVKGIKIMTQTAEAHIHPALGQVEVERLTRKQIEGWHVALSTAPKRTNRKPKADEEPEEAKDMTRDQERARRDTANRILTVLKALLNFAADRGRTGASSLPWRLVKPFKGTTSQRMRFLTVAEQKKLVAACDEEFRPLVMGALYTGGRYGELCAVKVRDFNATTKTLFIEWGKGKGDSVSRYVSLTPEAVTWFSEFTKGREPNELMWRRKAVARTKRAKTLADPDSWASYDQDFPMEKAVKAAGVERVTFHELRHTYASTLLNAGCPLVFVAQQLGHKDTRMCERHYGHIARLALAKSIEKLSPKLGLNISEVVKPVKAVKAKTEAKVSAT
jgi:integrase